MYFCELLGRDPKQSKTFKLTFVFKFRYSWIFFLLFYSMLLEFLVEVLKVWIPVYITVFIYYIAICTVLTDKSHDFSGNDKIKSMPFISDILEYGQKPPS